MEEHKQAEGEEVCVIGDRPLIPDLQIEAVEEEGNEDRNDEEADESDESDPDMCEVGEEGPVRYYGAGHEQKQIVELKTKGKFALKIKTANDSNKA